jgi:hypothetical protein
MIRIVDGVVARAIFAYRVLFVGGTAVLAVGTSRLAAGDGGLHAWLITIGAGCVMYAADVFGEVDGVSRELSGRTSKALNDARADVFRSHSSWATMGLMSLGTGLVIFGLL